MASSSSQARESIASTQQSMTAVSVFWALERALQLGYAHLFSEQEQQLIAHFAQAGRQTLPVFSWEEGRPLFSFNGLLFKGIGACSAPWQEYIFEKAVAARYSEQIMLRKILIKETIENAIERGVKQVIFLGGGYDIRALLTGMANPGVRVCEMDRAPTRDYKIQALFSAMNGDFGLSINGYKQSNDGTIRFNDNLFYINCDLSEQNLSDVLMNFGFDSAIDSLIIAEGLTMYLSPEDNLNLLRSAAEFMTDNSELLLSYVTNLNVSLMNDLCTKSSGEVFKFAPTPDNVIPFVAFGGLGVVSKFCAIDCLDAGLARTQRVKEDYYLIRKPGPGVLLEAGPVPVIELRTPIVAEPTPSSACAVL